MSVKYYERIIQRKLDYKSQKYTGLLLRQFKMRKIRERKTYEL